MRVEQEQLIVDKVFTINPKLFPDWLLPRRCSFEGVRREVLLCTDDDDVIYFGDN